MNRSRSRARWALLGYALLTCALTYPLLTRFTDGVPNDLGDPLLVGWILWWNAHVVPFTDAFWNAPAFYPAHGVLAFSEHFMGLSVFSTPIYWLTGNIQLAYNVVFLLTFLLSAFFGYLLCRAVTGREDAAFVGGLIYGFTPYRIDQLPHMQMLISFWMPLALFGLHRYIQTARRRWLATFAAGWVMQGLSSGYLMLFFSVLVAAWICWFIPWRAWRQWLAVGGTWALSSTLLLPSLVGYIRIHDFYGFKRNLEEIQFYSADITGVIQAPMGVLAWRWLNTFPHPEGAIFPGITAVLLILISLGAVRARSFSTGTVLRRFHTAIGALTLLFVIATITAFFVPWQIPALGLSNTHPDKPANLAVRFLLLWIATHPLFIGAFKRRSAFAFYLLAAVLMWALSLGPVPMYLGQSTQVPGPYSLLANLPGFESLRAPGRFAMVMILCLSVAGAIALTRLAGVLSRRGRIVVTVVASILALADGWTLLHVEARPEPWPIQARETHDPVVELPLGDGSNDIVSMYRSTYTGNPIVNGYSGNFAPWYAALTQGLQRHDPLLLEELSGVGVRQVVLDMRTEDGRQWDTYFQTRPDMVLIAADTTHRLYRLPPAERPGDRPMGRPMHVASIDVTVNKQILPLMTDGDLHTRWQTGPQKGTEQVTIDLGTVTPVGSIVLNMGEFTTDSPKDLLVEVSDDRQTWSTVWRGHGEGRMFLALMKDPKRTPFAIDLADRPTRYVRLSQLGSDPVWYWTIAELTVLAPAGR